MYAFNCRFYIILFMYVRMEGIACTILLVNLYVRMEGIDGTILLVNLYVRMGVGGLFRFH
jgi:hypothetical protein